jgi:hypothetical protein
MKKRRANAQRHSVQLLKEINRMDARNLGVVFGREYYFCLGVKASH